MEKDSKEKAERPDDITARSPEIGPTKDQLWSYETRGGADKLKRQ